MDKRRFFTAQWMRPALWSLLMAFWPAPTLYAADDAPVKAEEEEGVDSDWLYQDWTYGGKPHGEADFIRAAEAFNVALAVDQMNARRSAEAKFRRDVARLDVERARLEKEYRDAKIRYAQNRRW